MSLEGLSAQQRALLASLDRQTCLDGHEVLARRLKLHGVTHVYGISGTPVDETLAACGGHGIRVIATRHQQAAVQAAAAHNYLSGGLKAVVIVSAGPGVSNCVTGVTVADANHWPLLVIGGRRPLAMRGMGAFQELDGASLLAPITKYSGLVEETSGIPDAIDRACRVAMHRQPGPCYLDISEEALRGTGNSGDAWLQPDKTSAGLIDRDAIVSALERARRPVLVIGEGIRWGDPWEVLDQLVGDFRLPFVTSPMARGYLPDSHVLCGTRVRSWLLGSADLVLIAGASLDWVFRHGAEIQKDTRLIRLGHESDPVFQGRAIGLEYLGEPADLLRQLLADLEKSGTDLPVDETWLDQFARYKQAYLERLGDVAKDKADPPTPLQWLSEVAKVLPEGTVTILDGNTVMEWAQHTLPAELPLSRLTPGANGCMGVGVPFAMAACLAQPDHPVLAVCGDFALGLGIMDLETVVRHQLPLVILVANNSGSGGCLRQRAFWPRDYPERVCQFMEGIRYDLIFQAMGGVGMAVDHAGQILPAVEQAFGNGRPTLIQIDTRDDVPLPRL